MASHISTTSTATAAEPDMFSILNHPPQQIPGPALLHELIDHTNPESLAIDGLLSDGSRQTLSYAQLAAAAESLALQILDLIPRTTHRTSREFVVPILIPQCPSLYVAMLAILKAGGGFCPLQLDAPPERIKFILEDVGASVVLAAPGFVDMIQGSSETVQVLTVPEYLELGSASSPNSRLLGMLPQSPDSLAYVMYTSGSTGTPKGVGISHAAATQSLLAHERHVPPFDRFLQFASPTFDVSVFEIFFPLSRGSTLVTCNRSTMLDDLPAVIARLEVDACELTPTVVDSLLRTRDAVPTLRLLLTIGEMLTDRVVAEFGGDENQPSILWGMYGPTEAAIHCTLQPAFPTSSSPKNIGVPLDTVSCFIARIPEDEAQGPYAFDLVNPGIAGELVVGGFQLATGYLNRPEKTAEAFIDTDYGRLYRTGDRARLRDGTIECLGRIADGQIKLRGQRIELGEIEQALLRDVSCQSAIAMVIGGIIVAFCTAKDSTVVDSAALAEACKEWLPSFMVPGDIVRLDDYPRLPSGKINRQLLKQQYEEAREADTADNQQPGTTDADCLTSRVVALVSQTLDSRIDVTARLAAHGLDSLKAIKVASTLRVSGINATALDVLQANTIASLCETIRANSPSGTAQSQTVHIKIDELVSSNQKWLSLSDVEAAYPCTPLQTSMLFETTANSAAYQNNVELEFPSDCSLDTARRALERLIESNDILRSGFLLTTEMGFVRVVYRKIPESHIQVTDAEGQADDPHNPLHLLKVHLYKPAADCGPRATLWLHHATYDGWTVDLMTHDLSLLLDGEEKPYRRPQFDQVSSFYASIPSPSLDKSRSYWAAHLQDWQSPGFPKLLHRPSEQPSAQPSISQKLDIATSDLTNVASRLSAHPQAFFQAALVWLWSTYLGRSDVAIGTIASGRTISVDEVEHVMGPCITPAPLRVDLNTVLTGTHLVRAVQSANRESLQHSLLPLSEIRKVAGITGASLYDVLFVYQESLYSRGRTSRKVREISHRDALETKILVEIEPTDAGEFYCHITFHDDAISQRHAQLMLEQIGALSRHLISQPDAPIARLHEALPCSAKSIHNSQPTRFQGVPDLATSFEHTARVSPNATALCFATSVTTSQFENITYAELDLISNQLAWHLRNTEGVSEGGVVAIIMEKSTLLYAAILATVKAGCAYLPLLPSTPVERAQTILAQAFVGTCLTDSKSIGPLSAAGLGCKVVDVQALNMADLPTEHVPRAAEDGSRPSYIIYTSGTTGVPKGIVVSQLNVVSMLDVLGKIYPVDGPLRLLQLCSQAFDVSVFEIFFTWTVGGCLCSGTNDVLFADIERAIRALGCTHLSMTPTVAALVHPSNIPEVRFLVTAGEPMTAAVAAQWGDLLYQGYGPAETTNICTVKRMRQGDYIGHLGHVFANTSVFVLSPESTDPVPLGAYGEFCFGGDQVALGYMGLPDVTAAKFVDHPSLGRIYRSGDMGRMLPDQSLYISGRLDGQVKLRGQRIETGEVDSVVTSSDGDRVASAATLIVQNKANSRDQLVCFYVPTGQESDADEIHASALDGPLKSLSGDLYSLLRSKVPEYMVPSFLVPISAIPLTSSGKTDKRRLRGLFEEMEQSYLDAAADARSSDDQDTDWTTVERQVASAVTKTLGVPVDELSRWLPLTAFGLDSISAISLCQHLEVIAGRRPPISALLRDPSIAQIAHLVDDDSKHTYSLGKLPSFPPDWAKQVTHSFSNRSLEISAVLPCTPLQEAMLSSTGAYVNQLVLRLLVSKDAAHRAWENLARRHGILRTCFLATPDAQHPIAQVVLQSWSLPWSESRHSSLQDGVTACAQQLPAGLDSYAPPYRLDLLNPGAEQYLCLTCHHALYDGDSIRVLLSEFESLVNGEPLPDAVPYEAALRYMINLPDSTTSFWRRTLYKFCPPKRQFTISKDLLPINMQRPASVSLKQVQTAAKQHGVSLLAICQAAWAMTLSALTETEDVCFGNVMSGRTIPIQNIQRIAGPCFNTVPFRVNLGQDSLASLLGKIHQANIDALEYQFTPLRQVKRAISDTGRDLFDTILLLQRPQESLDPGVWELIQDTGDMDVALVCEIAPSGDADGLSIALHSHRYGIIRCGGMSDTDLLSAELSPRGLDTIFDAFGCVLKATSSLGASVTRSSDFPPEVADGLSRIVMSKANNVSPEQSSVPADRSDWDETELSIRAILSQLSNIPERRILKHQTIFQLGLDSINAVQAANLLRQRGLNVTTIDIMEAPSCTSLVGRLRQKTSQKKGVDYDINVTQPGVNLSQFDYQYSHDVQKQLNGKVKRLLPCTPVQCGMLSDFIRSSGNDYFNSLSFDVSDPALTVSRLTQAWHELIRHHSILTTGFVPVDHPHTTFAMVQYESVSSDLISLVKSTKKFFDVAAWRRECSQKALADLSRPPWRICLESSDDKMQMHLVIHHALYDAESLQALLHDLHQVLLGQTLQDVPSNDAAVTEILDATMSPASESFWKSLSSSAVLNRFPTMTPLIESPSTAGIAAKTLASRVSLAQLTTSAQEAGVTPQAILQAAWATVLSAYLGEPDVVFGVVLSGRTSSATEYATIPCITTLPIIAHVDEDSQPGLVQSMMDYNTKLAAHQHTPLSKIQRWLGHAGNRLFDTLLVYQRSTYADRSELPWKVVYDEGKVDYPVSLEIEPSTKDECLRLRLSYTMHVLPPQQASLLLSQFDAILTTLSQPPTVEREPLWLTEPSIFSILPPAEPNIPSEEVLLHQFVESAAINWPARTAIEYVTKFHGDIPDSQIWTFQELNEMGNRAANMLLASTQSASGIVAIHFDKCPEALFSILGILKAGFSFLALDPSAPKDRKEFILEDSKAVALLTGDGELAFTPRQPVIQVTLPSLRYFNGEQPPTTRVILEEDTCYCLYTSGTTGTPKGCEITHNNAVQAMKAFQRLFHGHWDDNSRWLQFAAFHFDVTVLEQYWSWSVGMALVSAPRDLILDDIAGTIRRLRITHIDLTPSLARLVDPIDVPSLCKGVFITGGEALKQEILDVWGPPGVIYNAYGPTEATIGITMYQRVPKNGRASNIGRQFDNVGSYVVHPGTDILVLRGAVGELCVSGKLVGKGYLNRPELTSERFPTLFGEKVYRTGDLVRVLHDGCFEFLGRADDQVKLRGQRLELGEINHVIRTGMPALSDTVALVVRNEKLEKDLLVSFVTSNRKARAHGDPEIILDEDSTIRRDVQRVCRDKLPGYMVPSLVLEVSYIPLSVNNKADFKTLRRLFNNLTPERLIQSSTGPGRESTAALTTLQTRLLKTVQEFSDIALETLDLSSNLFDIGVDSISALKLCRMMKSNGLTTATPTLILRNPLLEDLAEAIREGSKDSSDADDSSGLKECQQNLQAFDHRVRSQILQEMPLSDNAHIEYVAPCTPLQEGMLARTASREDDDAYFVTFQLRLLGGTSTPRLRKSWERLIAEHAILRTRFAQTSAGFAQVAIRDAEPVWEEVQCRAEDFDSLVAATRDGWVRSNQQKVIASPFKLSLVETPSHRILMVQVFHGLYDGVSLELMLNWVARDYNGEEQAPAPHFIDVMPYGPARDFRSSQPFWQAHLAECKYELQPRVSQSSRQNVHYITKSLPIQKLDQCCKQFNVTMQTLVLAVWSAVFSSRISKDAAFGVVSSGRSLELEGAESVIGPLFNTLPFFANAIDLTWQSLVQRCHEYNTGVMQFQHVPLRNIQKWCANGQSIFNSLFVFQGIADITPEADQLWEVNSGPPNPDYPLAFEAIIDKSNTLHVHIVAQVEDGSELSVENLLEEFEICYASLSADDSPALNGAHSHSAPVSSTTSAAPTPQTILSSSSTPAFSTGHSTPDLRGCDFEWSPASSALLAELSAVAKISRDKITPITSFFELGLDSIDLVVLSSRLKNIGLRISLSQLMKAQNIAVVSSLMEADHGSTSSDSSFDALKLRLWAAVKPSGWDMNNIETILPPTPLQESMVADMLDSGFERYFNHAVFEIGPTVDLQRLTDAWSHVIRETPTLRTIFRQVHDTEIPHSFVQIILRDPRIKIDIRGHVDDLVHITADHKRRAMVANGASALLQISVAHVAQQAHLVLSIAHALYDGWSLALLHKDVAAAYHGTFIPRPDPEISIRSLLQPAPEQAKVFWSQYLSQAPPSILPPRHASADGTIHQAQVKSSMTSGAVSQFCKSHFVTLQTLGQACWASVLASWSGKLDVSFGVVLSGRDTEDMHNVMFPTMNTVAVRCVLHGSRALFLRYIQGSMADVYQHQTFPLRQAQLLSKPGPGRLFNTLFLLQRQPRSDETPYEALLKPISGQSATDFAVCVELEVEGDQLYWRISAQDGYCDHKSTLSALRQLDEVLEAFTTFPDLSLLSFDGDFTSVCGQPAFQSSYENESATKDNNLSILEQKDTEEWSPIEDSIRATLSAVTEIPADSIMKSNSLYQLGLDSISAIKVSALLRKDGVLLPVRNLLAASSIYTLAQQAHGQEAQPTEDATSYVLPSRLDISGILQRAGLSEPDGLVEDVLPALPMQVYMMTSWQNSGGTVFYHCFQYRITTRVPLEEQQINAAWSSLVASDPLLRTCLLPTGDRDVPFIQAILGTNVSGPHQTINSDPVTSCWPLVRLTAEYTNGRWELLLRIHHALYDGVSMASLVSRLSRRLSGEQVNDISIPQRNAWKSFISQHFTEPNIVARKTFWTRYLADLDNPQRISTKEEDTSSQRTSYFHPAGLNNMNMIETGCARRNIGFSSLFFAAVANALRENTADISQEDEIVLGLYLANRTETADEPALPTLNLLPCRVPRNADIFEQARIIQSDVLNITSLVNSKASLSEIYDWTGLKVDVFVNLLSLPTEAFILSSGNLEELAPRPSNLPSPEVSAPWLSDNAVRDAFPVSRSCVFKQFANTANLGKDAMDIEASVRGKSLAIGVFGSNSRVSRVGGAETLVESIRRILQSCEQNEP